MGTSVKRSSRDRSVQARAPVSRFPARKVDGMDVTGVYEGRRERPPSIPAEGKGPYILEMKTYRYRGHSMSDPAKYRKRDEVDEYATTSDPIDPGGQNADRRQAGRTRTRSRPWTKKPRRGRQSGRLRQGKPGTRSVRALDGCADRVEVSHDHDANCPISSSSVASSSSMVMVQGLFSNLEHKPQADAGARDQLTDGQSPRGSRQTRQPEHDRSAGDVCPLVLVAVVADRTNQWTQIGAGCSWRRALPMPRFTGWRRALRTLAWSMACSGTGDDPCFKSCRSPEPLRCPSIS